MYIKNARKLHWNIKLRSRFATFGRMTAINTYTIYMRCYCELHKSMLLSIIIIAWIHFSTADSGHVSFIDLSLFIIR